MYPLLKKIFFRYLKLSGVHFHKHHDLATGSTEWEFTKCWSLGIPAQKYYIRHNHLHYDIKAPALLAPQVNIKLGIAGRSYKHISHFRAA